MNFPFRLVFKNLRRRPLRTALTVAGTASAFLLLVLVQSLSSGLDRAFEGSDAHRTLIVYRKNRYCPQTSNLPQTYTSRIEALHGVESVLPVQVFLNNCRASLDIVTFQGVPVERLRNARHLVIETGSFDEFTGNPAAALVGRSFASRRGLSVGDRFRFGTIDVHVAGIYSSNESVAEGNILTHLDFLQRAAPVKKTGIVTLYEVRVANGAEPRRVAEEIDQLFAASESPTDTRLRAEFLASATTDLREMLRFGQMLALVSGLVVLVLVGNTVIMSVQERTREFGVFLTLGYGAPRLLLLVLFEGIIVALSGAILGLIATILIIKSFHLSLGVEGVNVDFVTSPALAAKALGLALFVGAAAALYPALRAASTDPVTSLRSVG